MKKFMVCLALSLVLAPLTGQEESPLDYLKGDVQKACSQGVEKVFALYKAKAYVDGKKTDTGDYTGKVNSKGALICPTDGEVFRIDATIQDDPGQMEFYMLTDTELFATLLTGCLSDYQLKEWAGMKLKKSVRKTSTVISGSKKENKNKYKFTLTLKDNRLHKLVETRYIDKYKETTTRMANFTWTVIDKVNVMSEAKMVLKIKAGKSKTSETLTLKSEEFKKVGEYQLPVKLKLTRVLKKPRVSQYAHLTLSDFKFNDDVTKIEKAAEQAAK